MHHILYRLQKNPQKKPYSILFKKKHDILVKKNPLKRIIFYSIYKETRSNRNRYCIRKNTIVCQKTMKTVPYSVLYSKKLKTKHIYLVYKTLKSTIFCNVHKKPTKGTVLLPSTMKLKTNNIFLIVYKLKSTIFCIVYKTNSKTYRTCTVYNEYNNKP